MDDMNIRVEDPVALADYGQSMMDYAESYSTEIANIYLTLETLENSWTGAKSQKFMDTLGNDKDKFTTFGDNLNNFGDLIKKTGEAYSAWDK